MGGLLGAFTTSVNQPPPSRQAESGRHRLPLVRFDGRHPMRFSELGGYFQTNPGSEGDTLCKAGLLVKTTEGEWSVGLEPSGLLRSLFCSMPPLEEIYPLLVEVVLY